MSNIEGRTPFTHASLPLKNSSNFATEWKGHIKLRTLAYFGIPRYLQQSWLMNMQHKAITASTASSVFELENGLIWSLFGSSSDLHGKSIFRFCNRLILKVQAELAQQNSLFASGTISECKEQIGQMIFLAERNRDAVATLLDVNDIAASIKSVRTAFDLEVEAVLKDLMAHCLAHKNVAIQEQEFVMSTKKPLAIASMLMTSTGLLNLGLIDLIKQRFFKTDHSLLRWEHELLDTLDVIGRSQEIRDQLLRISKPNSSSSSSNDVIRITLGLHPDEKVTDQQARLVALAAILSDMRQGDVGTCFATSVSILMMGTLRHKVVSDFSDILQQGYISRSGANSENAQSDFVPVLDIGDSVLRNRIYLDSNGQIESTNNCLWDAPGVIAACRQLGLVGSQVATSIRGVIDYICQQPEFREAKTMSISIEELIELLIIRTKGDLHCSDFEDLKTLATVAFSAETNVPLLRAWESCLAAMAEARSGNHVRGKILRCIEDSLMPGWPKSCVFGLSIGAKKVREIFLRLLNSGMQIRYDEQTEVGASKKGGDGHSKMLGAFVLHELLPGNKATAARKIVSPDEFHSFVLNRLNITKQVVESIHPISEEQRQGFLGAIDRVSSYVRRTVRGYESFLYNAMRVYDEENNDLLTSLQNWDGFEHLPFRDATGNDNAAVFVQATGFAVEYTSIRPRNAQQLLESFIAFGRQQARIDGYLSDDDPFQRYMADTPPHAFTLTPEDPTVVGAMKGEESINEWIARNITQPGMAISDIKLTESQKTCFINAIKTELVPKEFHNAFGLAIKEVDPSMETVYEYSNQLINVVSKTFSHKDTAFKSLVAHRITTILIEKVLPVPVKKVLCESAARIADTNWVDQGVKHIYFACFFDPVAKAVVLGTIDEDGSNLRPQEQDEWVTYVPWELYGVKLTPTLSEHKVEPVRG